MTNNEAPSSEEIAAMRSNWREVTDPRQINVGINAGPLAVEGAQNADNDQGK